VDRPRAPERLMGSDGELGGSTKLLVAISVQRFIIGLARMASLPLDQAIALYKDGTSQAAT
jgi:hypothetical protein